MIAADDIYKYMYFFIVFFLSEKIRLDVSSESSARQRIHMKNKALFSSKDKSEKLKCRLLQFLFGALRVKESTMGPVLIVYPIVACTNFNTAYLHLESNNTT